MPLRVLFIALLILGGCTNQVPIVPSQAIPAAESSFGAGLEARAAEHQGHSGFRLLPASNEAFAARAELIRAAQHSLDLQYYIVHDGLSTRALVKELLQAADRGVRIRILLDDTTSDGEDYRIALLAAHPNIQIRVFNPLHLGRLTGVTRVIGRGLNLSQQHRRMHNKLWLADSAAAIVGGRNLGDEYFDAEPNMNFTDIDMLAIGPVARDLAQSFDQYWNSRLSKPIEEFVWRQPSQKDLDKARKGLRDYLDTARVEQPELYERLLAYQHDPKLKVWLDELIWAPGIALWDAPSKVLASGEPDPQLLLTTQLAPHLQGAKRDLVMVSAYFVPAPAGLQYLIGLADNGVEIRLLTNALEATDVPAVHGGYAPYRQEMLEHGMRLFELRSQPGADSPPAYSFSGSSNSSLHSKAIVIDKQKSFVGSFNVDPRSVLWNTEVGVLVDSPKLAAYLRELALQGMKPSVSYEVRLQHDANGATRMVWLGEDDGKEFVLNEEPGSRWRRFNAWFARAIGLEKML